MARSSIGIVTGLAVWLAIVIVAGLILRETWPAYASVADAMTFTLPMMIARLSISALATIAMGFVTARITRSALTRLVPGIILVMVFIPQHMMLWEKFPLWYHLWFLLSLVPLTYLGNSLARDTVSRESVISMP
jgi:hypothetical protein